MVAYHKPKSLRYTLVRAEIRMEVVSKGCPKSGSVRCKVSHYVTEDTKFRGPNCVINYKLNCNSETVVHLFVM